MRGFVSEVMRNEMRRQHGYFGPVMTGDSQIWKRTLPPDAGCTPGWPQIRFTDNERGVALFCCVLFLLHHDFVVHDAPTAAALFPLRACSTCIRYLVYGLDVLSTFGVVNAGKKRGSFVTRQSEDCILLLERFKESVLTQLTHCHQHRRPSNHVEVTLLISACTASHASCTY